MSTWLFFKCFITCVFKHVTLLLQVNQTVDTLMSERSRLQTELQASCVEAESLRTGCSRLEQDKAQLLERLGSLQHQQVSIYQLNK